MRLPTLGFLAMLAALEADAVAQLETSHFHSAHSARPQVPTPRPLPRRGRHRVESPGPAHSGSAAEHIPALLATHHGARRATVPSAEPAPTRHLQRTGAG